MNEHFPERDDFADAGSALDIPVPPEFDRAIGYRRDARFVGFFWIPAGDEVVYDDGIVSATGDGYVFLCYARHPTISPSLLQYNIGSSDLEADHILLLDRDTNTLRVSPIEAGRRWLREQHPFIPEMPAFDLEHLAGEMRTTVDQLQVTFEDGWREVRVDQEVIRQAMWQQHLALRAVQSFLDGHMVASDNDQFPGDVNA
jgi:hypothetical protein